MNKQDLNIPREVLEIIEKNGNNFHAKVARWFTDYGWHVVVSPYYMDQTQGKAREIDLVVEKNWPIKNNFGRGVGYIITRLFVECKYIPSYSVFWFSDRDYEATKKLICKDFPRLADNRYIDQHHYLKDKPRVAKLFASSKDKSIENDLFYKALNQALNAMISMRDHPISSPPAKSFPVPVLKVLNFPVVVCHSFEKLFSADFQQDTPPQKLEHNFQLEVLYAYIDSRQKPQNEYFILDFIEFDQLEHFHAALEQEANILGSFV